MRELIEGFAIKSFGFVMEIKRPSFAGIVERPG
jgi:hypothetical protein